MKTYNEKYNKSIVWVLMQPNIVASYLFFLFIK